MNDPLGDEISKVELIGSMGDDLTVSNCARVSMNKKNSELTEGDKSLIRFLAENEHWTPFAHPQVQFRIKMPFFVAREWFRSTVGFARNEVSRRYVKEEPKFYTPETKRGRPDGVKQGSNQEEEKVSWVEYCEIHNMEFRTKRIYREFIENGWAPELARMFLPMNTYTEFIETGSLYAYARLCNQRLASDSQKEIRRYAESISEEMRKLFPLSWYHLVNKERE